MVSSSWLTYFGNIMPNVCFWWHSLHYLLLYCWRIAFFVTPMERFRCDRTCIIPAAQSGERWCWPRQSGHVWGSNESNTTWIWPWYTRHSHHLAQWHREWLGVSEVAQQRDGVASSRLPWHAALRQEELPQPGMEELFWMTVGQLACNLLIFH